MEERITLNHRYEIIDKVGGGGMAEVFHGYDTVLHRDVGIKILRDQFIQDKDFVARFRQEACNAAGLSHPNIVNIYDFGSEHDINYIVMEYVVGRTLKEVITDSGALDYQTAVKYAIGIASALKQAHDHAIVHCDVKSQNILIDTKGVAKITDFGIARAFGQPSESEERGVIGSVYYLSPEQAAGKPVTAQSDLYSLGVVLFEMLTGQLPYDGDTPAEVARQHLTSPTPSARRYDPEIPYDLDAIVTKALAKNPLLRYKTDDDFLSDLRRVETRLRKAARKWGTAFCIKRRCGMKIQTTELPRVKRSRPRRIKPRRCWAFSLAPSFCCRPLFMALSDIPAGILPCRTSRERPLWKRKPSLRTITLILP